MVVEQPKIRNRCTIPVKSAIHRSFRAKRMPFPFLLRLIRMLMTCECLNRLNVAILNHTLRDASAYRRGSTPISLAPLSESIVIAKAISGMFDSLNPNQMA